MNSQEWSPRTFGNEERLPRVPLPTVEDSCRRFLEWCAPLLTGAELAETEAAVAAYLRPGSPAHTLHAELERFDGAPGTRSWLDRFWPARYLGRRDRIALNANFFFLFGGSPEGRVDRAAGLVMAALDVKLQLDEELVPPVIQRGQATSMEQFRHLFSTTRIPGEHQDTVRTPDAGRWPPPPARHIVALYRGNAFRLDVLGLDGRPYSLDDLAAGLETVMKAGATRAAPDAAVGRLTTGARAEWAANRQRLAALGPANTAALEVIETALFCLCLEDLVPADDQEACDQLLHGDSGNRWFDKAVSIVVFADGTAGVNIEHCRLDGTTVLGLVDAMLGSSAKEHAARAGAVGRGLPAVEPVEFVLDGGLRDEVRAAGDAFVDYAAATATSCVSLRDFGSDRAKQLGVSPDAFVQMAYQLAHRRARGLTGATYESIATRQYRNGRTEAMRVVTPQALRFVAAMDDPGAVPAERAASLREAAAAHVARSRDCQRGDAPEQHLWELQMIQQRRGAELGATGHLALYDSPGWRTMRDDYLSTSSAPSRNIDYFGFGSTSDRCIGVAYVLLADRLNIYLSTPRAVADQMHAFADRLREAITEMEALLAAEAAGT